MTPKLVPLARTLRERLSRDCDRNGEFVVARAAGMSAQTILRAVLGRRLQRRSVRKIRSYFD